MDSETDVEQVHYLAESTNHIPIKDNYTKSGPKVFVERLYSILKGTWLATAYGFHLATKISRRKVISLTRMSLLVVWLEDILSGWM